MAHIDVVLKSRLESPPYYYLFLYRGGQKIEKGTGQNVLAESDPLWVHVVSETEVYTITFRN